MNDKDKIKSIEAIGSSIQTYGHFATYTIPDESEKGLLFKTIGLDKFLSYVYNFYYRDAHNKDYGADLAEEKQTKKFLISRINEESYKIGSEWLEENKAYFE